MEPAIGVFNDKADRVAIANAVTRFIETRQGEQIKHVAMAVGIVAETPGVPRLSIGFRAHLQEGVVGDPLGPHFFVTRRELL